MPSDYWLAFEPASITSSATALYINYRNRLPQYIDRSLGGHCLHPFGTFRPDAYDADNEDPALDKICINHRCRCNARFIYCPDRDCPCDGPKESAHYCGDSKCRQAKHSPPVPASSIRFRPDGVLSPLERSFSITYHSATPKLRTSPGTTVSQRWPRPRIIDDYSPANAPPPLPDFVANRPAERIVHWSQWIFQPNQEQRMRIWNQQRPQREMDETSMVVGPPTDIDEFDDNYRVCPRRARNVPPHGRYINKRNKLMKNVFDIEMRVPVASSEESTDSTESTESDTTYVTALEPPLDSPGTSSAEETPLITPEARLDDSFFTDGQQGAQAEKPCMGESSLCLMRCG